MKYGSVCSGIESASLAWKPLGWEPVFFAENETFCSELLKIKHPGVPNHGDIRQFKQWPNYAIDLLVGGTPCQSFSFAGLRAGLDDPRGNLMLTYLAIADRYRPRWVVWENVPGVLSTDGGRPFGTFLGGLAKLGYGFAYRVLDAQFVRVESHSRAVPQRRRRVFVVGCIGGDWRRAAAVLFEPESLLGNPPPGRKSKEAIARSIGAGARERGGAGGGGRGASLDAEAAPTLDGRSGRSGGNNFATSGGLVPEISGPLGAVTSAVGGFRQDLDTVGAYIPEVAWCLQERDHKGCDSDTKEGHILPVAPTLRAGGNATGGDRPPGTDVDTCESLIPVAFDETQITNPNNRSNPQPGDPCHTLAGSARPPAVAYAFRAAGQDGFNPQNVSPPIAATQGGGAGVPSVAIQAYDIHGVPTTNGASETDVHTPLRSRTPGISEASTTTVIRNGWKVRRLMPIECERLQGMPDGYTRIIRAGGKPAADGPRYRALGNSKAVNVVVWIGQRIKRMEELVPPQ